MSGKALKIMFILSVNRKLFLRIAAAAAVTVLLAAVCVLIGKSRLQTPPDTAYSESTGSFTTIAQTPAQEVEFLGGFGLKPAANSRKSESVTIPRRFSGAYEKYNELQKKTGFDLTYYRGRQAEKVQYRLKNSRFSATLLITDGRVVAAHLSSGVFGEAYRTIDYGKTR